MKRFIIRTIGMLGLSAAFTSFAPSLCAAPIQLTADIPFAFHAYGKVLPAGRYEIDSGSAPGVFQLTNRAAHESEFLNASLPGRYMPTKTVLIFEHHESDYVLSEISIAGTAHTSVVPRTVVERNLTRKLGLVTMVPISLRRH